MDILHKQRKFGNINGAIPALLCAIGFLFASQAYAQKTSALECHAHSGWFDTDGDNIPDIIETGADADGDTVPNYLDGDSDGDGISDLSEGFGVATLAGMDENGNGIDDAFDTEFNTGPDDADPEADGVLNSALPTDTDNDGIADFLDTDSDNDGLPDEIEIGLASSHIEVDSDGDGLGDFDEHELGTAPNNWDTDGGGVSDYWEISNGTSPTDSTDDHSFIGAMDADGDGIANDVEGQGDADHDRIPNYLDLDSDNDGWFDIRESGLPDINHDGLYDDPTDNDGNGMADSAEYLVLELPDTDNDSLPDQFDTDSDNDGYADNLEKADLQAAFDAGILASDIDNDGLDNNKDLDADNDGINDIIEAGFYDGDSDGIVDTMTDIDADGIPDAVDVDFTADATDTDGDGIGDQFDTDHSDESVLITNWTTLEDEWVQLPNTDIDLDGIVDRHDADHDGDGLADDFSYLTSGTEDNDGDGLIAIHDADDNDSNIPSGNPETNGNLENPPATLAAALPDVMRPVDSYLDCALVPEPDTDANVDANSGNPDESSESPTTEPVTNSGAEDVDDPSLGAASASSSGGGGGLANFAWLILFLRIRRCNLN